MKTITLEIPDDGRKFRAFMGREIIAFTNPDEPGILTVKTESCNYCGECCMNEPATIYGFDAEGKCNKLVKDGDKWECSAGVSAPYHCLDDPHDIECCSIRYKKVPLG